MVSPGWPQWGWTALRLFRGKTTSIGRDLPVISQFLARIRDGGQSIEASVGDPPVTIQRHFRCRLAGYLSGVKRNDVLSRFGDPAAAHEPAAPLVDAPADLGREDHGKPSSRFCAWCGSC